MMRADTAERLAKLLPHLGSEHEGEVIATARAISRTLATAGLDWHEFGRVVERAGEPIALAAPTQTSASAAPNAPDAPCSRPGMTVVGSSRIVPWNGIALRCRDLDRRIPQAFGGRFLTPSEREQLRAIGLTGSVSNAEAAWLECVHVHAQAAWDLWQRSGHGKPRRPAAA